MVGKRRNLQKRLGQSFKYWTWYEVQLLRTHYFRERHALKCRNNCKIKDLEQKARNHVGFFFRTDLQRSQEFESFVLHHPYLVDHKA